MTMQRWAAVAAVVIGMAGSAAAGPIQWSYTSSGAIQGDYSFNPIGYSFETPAGQSQQLWVFEGVNVPLLVSPIPLNGPTLWSSVKITDTASGEASWLNVPVEFYDNEPDPDGVLTQHTARVGSFGPGQFVLGGQRYTVTNGGQPNALSVRVEDTPEPSTLVLAAGGLALVGWRRVRSRR